MIICKFVYVPRQNHVRQILGTLGGKQQYLGRFATELEATRVGLVITITCLGYQDYIIFFVSYEMLVYAHHFVYPTHHHPPHHFELFIHRRNTPHQHFSDRPTTLPPPLGLPERKGSAGGN